MTQDTADESGDRRSRLLILATIATIAMASACSTQSVPPPDEWWPGTVVGVMLLSEVPPDTERQCLLLPESELPHERTVVLVRRRIGRSPHTMAFLIPHATTLRVGERVRVDSDTCQIVPARSAGTKS